MKNLYIDFDGVIIDTYNGIDFRKVNNWEEEKIFNYFVNFPWEKILNDEKIINNAMNNIKEIIDSNKFNIAILTHVNSLKEGVLKINYIRKFFKDITIILCPKEVSKTKMVHTKDSILIDDFSDNLREWKSEGGIPVKFSLKEEDDEFIVINNLKMIMNLF